MTQTPTTRNVAARNDHTARLLGYDLPPSTGLTMSAAEAEKALFGWVYKEKNETTLNDCIRVLAEVQRECPMKQVDALLKKYRAGAVADIALWDWDNFYNDAVKMLEDRL